MLLWFVALLRKVVLMMLDLRFDRFGELNRIGGLGLVIGFEK